MRAVPLTLLALTALAVTGCSADRSIPSDRRQSVKLEAVKAAFTELKFEPVVDEKAGTVVSAWLWCGDKTSASVWAMMPATWARYRATATPDAVQLEGEAWGAPLLFPFTGLPLENVEAAITKQLKD